MSGQKSLFEVLMQTSEVIKAF